MYKKVLVPLDGSNLAECALRIIKDMAKERSAGEVILFRVVDMNLPLAYSMSADDIGMARTIDFQALWNEQVENAEKYFENLKGDLKAEGIQVETLVLKGGRPAQSILDYVNKANIDLIVMATHGYTGMKKMLLGSVAYQVLNESPAPVLLIRPTACLT